MPREPNAYRTPDPIAKRLRARRITLGLSLAELAKRAGVRAPSFLHHVEHGLRVPSPDVAARLARALGEDEELVRSWARLRAGCEIEQALAASRAVERAVGGGSQSAVEAPPSPLLRVPRYEEGADPGTLAEPGPEVAEMLRFDPAALPPEAWLKPFALRLGGGRPVPPSFQPHDLLLVTRNAWPIHSAARYVVRAPRGVAIGRLQWREPILALRGEDGAAQALSPSGTPPRALIGRVACVIRAGVDPGSGEASGAGAGTRDG